MAQTRPDFSGRWTSEPEPSTSGGGGQAGVAPGGGGGSDQRGGGGRGGSGDMGSGWGSNITVTQDTNRLMVEYARAFGGGGNDLLIATTAANGEVRRTSRGKSIGESDTI